MPEPRVELGLVEFVPTEGLTEGLAELVGSLVCVTWDDACFEEGDTDVKTMADEYLIKTAGIVLRVTGRSIFVSSDWSPDYGITRAVTRIPRIAVVGVERLVESPGSPESPGVEEVRDDQTTADPPADPRRYAPRQRTTADLGYWLD